MFCTKLLAGKVSLLAHQALHNQINRREPHVFQCHLCERGYDSNEAFNKHLAWHGSVSGTLWSLLSLLSILNILDIFGLHFFSSIQLKIFRNITIFFFYFFLLSFPIEDFAKYHIIFILLFSFIHSNWRFCEISQYFLVYFYICLVVCVAVLRVCRSRISSSSLLQRCYD